MALEEDKEKKDKEIAENVEAAGNAFLSSPLPSSDQQLLLLLDKLENYLLGVKQSPSNSVQKALKPALKALITKEFLYHPNVEVKVGVASCIIEITRITAPDAPYGDEQMKEIFKLIVAAFDNISDVSSPSYHRRVSILETFARIRLWVVMMDLECDSLILEMFELFLKNLRENHPDAVFMYMGYIMIMVLEEVEEISPELLSPILGCVRKGNKSVLPITRKLGERVIENCISKLLPYMNQTVQYLGFPLDDYGKIIAYICKQNSETLDYNKIHALQDSTGQKHLLSGRKSRGKSVVKKSNKQFFAKKIFRSAASDKNSSVNDRNVSMKISTKKSKKKGNPRKEKGSLAPNDGEPFGANLIGSRIKVSSKANMSCEGNIVTYDPIEKEHKVQFIDGDEKTVSHLKEQREFVGDESAACKGKLINNPILDASCEMHENKRPKIISNSSNEGMM